MNHPRAGQLAQPEDLVDVAELVDAYYERGLNPWDFAAGLLVATEAGAVVTDFDGAPAGSHGLLAAGSDLHEHLRQALGNDEA